MSRVLLVTGASSGIGRDVALRAARDGDDLVLLARGEGPLKATADACSAAGASSTTVLPTDVGDEDAVAAAFAEVDRRYGRIDAVAHCAGVAAYGRVEDVPPEVFLGVVRTNLWGSVNIARESMTRMRAQGRGSLVLVGSVVGHLAVPKMTPYVVSKWAVRSLARQLQLENRDARDVHVSYVAPGGVDTPIYGRSASYTGHAGKPPPPVASAEHVGGVVHRRLWSPRPRTQTGLLNDVMRMGFTVVPWAYDRMVGPLFALLATDRRAEKAPTPGNVLTPVEADATTEDGR